MRQETDVLTLDTDPVLTDELERMMATREDPCGRPDVRVPPGSAPTSRPATGPAGRPARPTILVADDDPEVLGTLEIMLSKSGFEVVLATDGGEAVDRFRRHAIDLLITDLAMPKLNGLQVAKICKHQKPTLPIVMVTAWGVLVAEDDQADAGIDVVLSKPVRMAEIVTAVRMLWEATSGREPQPGSDLE